MTILEVKNLTKDFGGIRAIDSLNLEVREGEILGLIGPNGAGKTTFFNVITGYYPPTHGRVVFKGEDITGLKPNEIASRGLIRTFQSINLFKEDTVLENVFLGFHMSMKVGFWGQLFKTRKQRIEEKEIEKQAVKILEFGPSGCPLLWLLIPNFSFWMSP